MASRPRHILNPIFLLLIVSACSSPDNRSDDRHSADDLTGEELSAAQQYFEKVFLPGREKIFRDISLDFPISKVKKIESQYDLVLSDEAADFLQYEKDLVVDTARGVDYVEVKYIFDKSDRLDIVTVNYYIQDSAMVNNLFEHLHTSFSDKFGDFYIDSDGYTVWESTYSRDTVEIAYDIGIRKFTKLNDPGITVELMRFGSL